MKKEANSSPDNRNRVDTLSSIDETYQFENGAPSQETIRRNTRLSNLLHAVIDDANVWVNVLDTDANVIIWNRAAERISGYSREEVVGNGKIWKWLYPDEEYRREITKKASDIIHNGQMVEDLETTIRTKDGQARIIAWHSTSLLDERDQPIGSVALGRDVTHQKKTEQELSQYRMHLEDLVKDRTQELQKSFDQLQQTIENTIFSMAKIVELRDPYTASHQRRVAQIAEKIACELNLEKPIVKGVKMAGIIHDLGKMYIPAEILSKPGPLTEPEFDIIRMHPIVGHNILKGIRFPWPLALIVLQHHEMLDGSGYPKGLKGDEILIEARILALSDVVETMSSHRPYRPAFDMDTVIRQITKNRDIRYDPDAVDACLALLEREEKNGGLLNNI